MGVAHFCLWADLKPEHVAALDAVSNEDGTRQVEMSVFLGQQWSALGVDLTCRTGQNGGLFVHIQPDNTAAATAGTAAHCSDAARGRLSRLH